MQSRKKSPNTRWQGGVKGGCGTLRRCHGTSLSGAFILPASGGAAEQTSEGTWPCRGAGRVPGAGGRPDTWTQQRELGPEQTEGVAVEEKEPLTTFLSLGRKLQEWGPLQKKSPLDSDLALHCLGFFPARSPPAGGGPFVPVLSPRGDQHPGAWNRPDKVVRGSGAISL